jgi:hypothetical protein
MPTFGSNYDSGEEVTSRSFGVGQADTEQAARSVYQQDRGVLSTLAGATVFAAPTLIDRTRESIAAIFGQDIKKDQLNDAIGRTIGAPALNRWRKDVAGATEVTSAILGIALSEIAATRMLAVGTRANNIVRSLPYSDRVLNLDLQAAKSFERVRQAELGSAARADLGSAQFTGRTYFGIGKLSSSENLITDFRVAEQLVTLRKAVLTEGILTATQNQNSFLFTDSVAENLAYASMGIALPAGLTSIMSNYKLRRLASDTDVLRAQRLAMDPSGNESKRGLFGARAPIFDSTYLDGISETALANATMYLTDRSHLMTSSMTEQTADALRLAGNREKIGNQYLQLAREQVGLATSKGLPHDGRTAFSLGTAKQDSPVGSHAELTNHMNRILADDPSAFVNMSHIGATPDGQSADEMFRALTKRTKARLEEELAKEVRNPQLIRNLRDLQKQIPVAFIDGEKVPIAELSLFEGYAPLRAYDIEVIKGESISNTIFAADGVQISGDFLVTDIGKSNQTGKPRVKDHAAVRRQYDLADYAIRKVAADQSAIVKIGPKPDFMQLDMAEELIRRTGNANKVQFPAGMTRESAQVESYAQKAERVPKLMADVKRLEAKGVLTREQALSRVRFQMNLPKLSAFEMHMLGQLESPAMKILADGVDDLPQKLRGMSLEQVKAAVAANQRLGDFADLGAKDIKSLSGNSFSYMKDANGNPMRPIVGLQAPLNPQSFIPDNAVERAAITNSRKRGIMIDKNADPITKRLAEHIETHPDALIVADVSGLRETQLTSSPDSFWGRVGQGRLTRSFVARDAPQIQGASRLQDSTARLSRSIANQVVQDSLGDSLNRLAGPRNAKSRLLLDQLASQSRGWELDKATAPLGRDNLVGFTLKDTEANRARWQAQYGEPMPEGALLRSGNGTVVAVDELGLDVATRAQVIFEAQRQAQNTLLRAQGQREIGKRDWYFPSPRLDGKIVGFVFGPDNQIVPNKFISAATPAEYSKLESEMHDELAELGYGYTVRSLDQVQQFGSAWDNAIADFVDSGTTSLGGGRKGRGATVESVVKHNAFVDAISNARDRIAGHGADVIKIRYDHTIKSNQVRAQASQPPRAHSRNVFSIPSGSSIYEMFNDTLLGRSRVNTRSSLIGPLYNAIEGGLDKVLATGHGKAAVVSQVVTNWLARVQPWSNTPEAKKDFESLSKALGEYMPFKDHAEQLESLARANGVTNSRDVVGKLAQFTAGVTLRFLEFSHAAVTAGGLLSAMPAVMRAYQPREGESIAEAMARNGHTGIPINTNGSKPFIIPDMVGIVKDGIKFGLSPESHEAWQEMVEAGMLKQDIAELHMQLAAVDSRGDIKKIFFGDQTNTGTGIKNKLARNGLIGSLSAIADSTEDFSRAAASITGYQFATRMGITTKEARLSFAHDFANRVIADYNPVNRPEYHQGAVGSAIGLFQSYTTNYYQRMFRFLEEGDYKGWLTQSASQGFMFGLPSVGGFSAYSTMQQWINGSDEDRDAKDGLRERMGGLANLIEGGALSNIPTLFGAPAIDFYSRGDVNPRYNGGGQPLALPTALPSTSQIWDVTKGIGPSAPAFSIVGKLWDGLGQAAEALIGKNPHLSSQQLAEIFSNMMVSRPIAGMIETVFADGFDVDKYGQVISESTTAAEQIYRILGTRTMAQSQDVDSFFANKSANQQQANLQSALRTSMRSAIREGTFDSLYDKFQDEYLARGGDPRYFQRFVNESTEAALETRSERQLESALKNPEKAAQVDRLLGVGVGVDEDDTVDASDTWDPFEGVGGQNETADAPYPIQTP